MDIKILALSVGVLVAAGLAGLLAHWLIFNALGRVAARTETDLDDRLVARCRGPARLIIPLLAVSFAGPLVKLPPKLASGLTHALSITLIIAVTWLFLKVAGAIEEWILARYTVDVVDNLQARKIHTQVRFFRRVVIVIIAVITLAAILMTFKQVRQVGTSILASAGVLGIIVGMAAQRTISNLLAGIQVVVTQPIRLDDVVIVEGEWGRIEEITLTYVVVRIWDLRRLVLPITYFIEKPFQNWTRVSADILGTVFIYTDYTIPVQELREELNRILEASPLWDGKAAGLLVTNAKETTLELRALMSAPDASKAWGLRCHVREKLVEFVQKNYPDSLPRVRAELEREGGRGAV